MATCVAFILAVGGLLMASVPAQASGDRELYLHYTHTKETIRIVYKRNGRFVPEALQRLNVFLRDWRRNEPANMDPALFDLLWEVYRETGSSQPIHVVSAYRAPQTNAMLASNSSGVASNSQHMAGKAIDFFIPGVSAAAIREIGFRKQIGGVGYYPSSGNPFVHLDTGSVRAWPRMTTAQLQRIFPDGRTLHIPSNGRVLSQQGYTYAQAEWQRCNRVPCGSGPSASGSTQVADSGRTRTLWDVITGGNGSESAPAQQAPASQQPAPQQVAAAPAPQPAPAPAPQAAPAAAPAPQAAAEPPTPPRRPEELGAETRIAQAPAAPQTIPFQVIDAAEMTRQVAMTEPTATAATAEAPVPPTMSAAVAELRETTAAAYAPSGGTLTVAAIQEAPVPPTRPDFAPIVTASVEPRAQVTAEPQPLPMRPSFSPGEASELDAFASLFEGVTLPGRDRQPDAATANALASLAVADGELFAPQLASAPGALLSGDAFPATSSGAGGGTIWVRFSDAP